MIYFYFQESYCKFFSLQQNGVKVISILKTSTAKYNQFAVF